MEQDLTLAVNTKGADEAADKIKKVSDNISDTGKSTSDFSDKLTKAGLAIGAVGIGLTAYSKSATDAYTNYVKQTNSIARITGEAVDQTSRLEYVFQRSGVAADQQATVFGTLQKQIQKTNEATGAQADKTADLKNKIEAAQIKIKELTDDTTKNGDSSGKNKNQIDALNISIKGYQNQINEAITPLQKLGVETQDNTGKARSFSDILLDISDKFKAMPNGAEKTAVSMQLFGRSGKDLIPVLNKGSDGIKEMMAQADKLGFTLTSQNVEAVAKYTEAHKKLKDAQQAFTLAVGAEALPMYQKLADAQVFITDKFKALPGPVKNAATAVVAFGGPVLTAAGSMLTFASTLSQINYAAIAKGFQAITNVTKIWAVAQGILNAVMAANPILLIILAIVALVAAFVLAWTYSETFRDIVTGVFMFVWNIIQAVWHWIADNWPLLLAILTGPIGIAVYMIATHWEMIKQAFLGAWQFITGLWGGLVGFFGAIFGGAMNAIRSAWGGITGFFQGIWNAIVNIFGSIGAAVSNGIVGAVRGVVNGILAGAEGIVNGFVNAINGVVGTINKIPGVNIGKIGQLHLPRLAEGGIVPATPGGRTVVVGEGGKDEAIIPLDKLNNMGGGTKNYYITANLNSAEAVRAFYAQLDNDTILSNKGLTPVRGGS